MPSLSVIIPFFNEAKYLSRLVGDLEQLPSELVKEFIFIDDGSSDNSVEVLNASLNNTTLKTSIHSKTNGGKASAVALGANFLTSTHALILDADLELATSDIPRLWDIVLENKSDVVFGYRNFISQSSFTWRYAKGNHAISNLYGLLFNEVITDIMCGYKLVPSTFLQSIPYKFKKYAIEIEIPIHLWKKRIRPFEIQVEYIPRTRSDGKGITVKDAVTIILTLISYRFLRARRI
jgi:glycosyltransferase involved in cell wall biosynthesis